MNEAVAAIVAAVIAGVVAVATSLLTAGSKVKELKKRFEYEQLAERQRDREKKRIQYLDPLVVSASDLLAKINQLRKELNEKEDFWKGTFNEVKTRDRHKKDDFAFWCNGYGAGAVTTLYVTVVYFARACKIRSEIPFIQLGPSDDQMLLARLAGVREAFGGEHNLWVEMQDVTESDGRIMNYKEFCTKIIDPWEHIWFIRLIDFYRDVHLKRDNELPRIVSALEKLISFAKGATQPDKN
jgi:gas vesicle protein